MPDLGRVDIAILTLLAALAIGPAGGFAWVRARFTGRGGALDAQTPVATKRQFCMECGAGLEMEAQFCVECGTALTG